MFALACTFQLLTHVCHPEYCKPTLQGVTASPQWSSNSIAQEDDSNQNGTPPNKDPGAATAAAAAAAAASSGLSATPQLGSCPSRQLAQAGLQDMPGSRPAGSHAVRAALLVQHDVALEQFGSMQEALEFLEQLDKQQTLVGLAAEDYQQAPAVGHGKPMQQKWGNWHPGAFAPNLYPVNKPTS